MRECGREAKCEYRVTLVCGCTIPMRNDPMNRGQRFVCSTGQGHGYRLRWASWECSDGTAGVNPDAG